MVETQMFEIKTRTLPGSSFYKLVQFPFKVPDVKEPQEMHFILYFFSSNVSTH